MFEWDLEPLLYLVRPGICLPIVDFGEVQFLVLIGRDDGCVQECAFVRRLVPVPALGGINEFHVECLMLITARVVLGDCIQPLGRTRLVVEGWEK